MDKNTSECEVMSVAADKVKGIVTGDRNKCYGTPSENHELTAAFWSLFLSRKWGFKVVITAEDHCWMMNLLKASRQAHWPQEDNAIDGCGYLLNSLACKHATDKAVQDDSDRSSPELHPSDFRSYDGTEEERNNIQPEPVWLHSILTGSERIPSQESQADRLSACSSVCQ